MRAWLHEKDLKLEERDLFQAPFTEEELLQLLGHRSPAELFSWKSPSFKALGLSPDGLNDLELIRLMLQEPRLIRRPLVQVGDNLIIGADQQALDAAFP